MDEQTSAKRHEKVPGGSKIIYDQYEAQTDAVIILKNTFETRAGMIRADLEQVRCVVMQKSDMGNVPGRGRSRIQFERCLP